MPKRIRARKGDAGWDTMKIPLPTLEKRQTDDSARV